MSAQKDLDCTFFEKLSQFLQSQIKLYVWTQILTRVHNFTLLYEINDNNLYHHQGQKGRGKKLNIRKYLSKGLLI